MSESPHVDVKAVVITRGEAVLLVYNENWGSYCLPMSKARLKHNYKNPADPIEETPVETAIRVLSETLGRPLGIQEVPHRKSEQVIDTYHMSLRDGIWKTYHTGFFEFELPPSEHPRPLGGLPFAWMTVAEMKNFTPVSPDAITIAGAVMAAKRRG